jgi:hypothetical protein
MTQTLRFLLSSLMLIACQQPASQSTARQPTNPNPTSSSPVNSSPTNSSPTNSSPTDTTPINSNPAQQTPTLKPGVYQTQSANSFVDSIGVNTHVDYTDTAYGQYDAALKPSLMYLGVRHIRDGIDDGGPNSLVLKRYRDLHANGIRLTAAAPYETKSMPALIAMIKTQRDVLEAVEGPNETDIFEQFIYKGQKFHEGTIAFMKDFYPAMKADPQLRDLPVLQTTLAFPGYRLAKGVRADLLGDLSKYADYGNSHNYFDFGEIPSNRIKNFHIPLNSRITPGKPMMSSEGGYQMGDGDGYKGTWDDGQSAPFSEDIHGRYLLRYVLEQYRLGYTRSFIYELLDIDKPKWGLFRADGTPKPAATGIRNLIGILNENTVGQPSNAPNQKPGTLEYELTTQTPSVHTLLLQKSNGTSYLILWNEFKNWNAVTGKPVYSNPVPVGLRIKQTVKRIRTYLPLTQREATQTFDSSPLGLGSLQLNVPDHPLIVEIEAK